jgi:tRNA1Val (adenine37-N6)-methyltransferase
LQELLLGPDETLDPISRSIRIIQKRDGHRVASDDVLLAWAGTQACPGAKRVLDLGSGKGTVALLMLSRLPGCRVVGVEALHVSHELAVRNACLNRLEDRYEPRLGDLRDPSVLFNELPFHLITGAPPFKKVGSGTLPKSPQRAASRFEFRGGVGEYVETASRHLAPNGKLVILMDGLEESRARVEHAIKSCGLFPHLALSIRPRPDHPPVYWIFEADSTRGGMVENSVSIRPAVGNSWSKEFEAIREEMELPSRFR